MEVFLCSSNSLKHLARCLVGYMNVNVQAERDVNVRVPAGIGSTNKTVRCDAEAINPLSHGLDRIAETAIGFFQTHYVIGLDM